MGVLTVAAAFLAALCALGPAEGPPAPQGVPTPAPLEVPSPGGSIPQPRERVRLTTEGGVEELDLEEYVVGVVAAEMPASFSPAALEAQSVAARTYAVSRGESSPHGPEGEVCGDPGCCQAYLTLEERLALWGEERWTWEMKVRRAVAATAGQVLTYDGEPIQAVFHASSLGQTAGAEEVWGGAVPYLTSVSTPEREGEVPGLVTVVEVPWESFKAAFLGRWPQGELGEDPAGWVTALRESPSGHVGEAEIGGVTVTGQDLRTLLDLRSTAFTVETGGNGLTFTVRGHGHGVGMSQYGAETMAREGADWQTILAHYYPNTRLTEIGG